jgi:hypothetical protein
MMSVCPKPRRQVCRAGYLSTPPAQSFDRANQGGAEARHGTYRG